MENQVENKKTEISYYNPIENKDCILIIPKMPVNRVRLGGLHKYETDEDIYNILIKILKDLDLSKTCSGMLICTTDSVRYSSLISEYIYYLEHSINQLEYNHWIDVLIQRHLMNIVIEKNFVPPTIKKSKDKNLIDKTGNLKNMFYKRQVLSLFDENPQYEYINPKTGEIITSDNPNLCDKLNEDLDKLKAKNKTKRNGGGRHNKSEGVTIVKTPDFSKFKFKF